jgi:alkylation response protein AidB-like acyl-CoA dehydrogenase
MDELTDQPMDLQWTDAQEAFRAEARAWLASHAPAPRSLPSLDTAEGFEAHRAWEGELAADRWSVVSWPEEFGGRGVGILEWLVFEEEYWRVQAPLRVSQNGVFLLAPTMFEFGTAAQKARFLPPMASAREIWCQGWSEPDAGSDLAGIRSRARRSESEGGWVLSGQKTWASRGAFAEWCFGLFRTDPDAERHRGLTYFLIDLATPGVTVRPIPQIDGETGFAELFFEDVFVPDDLVLGDVGKGWNVAMATAGSERGLSLRSPARYSRAADRLVELYADRVAADPARAQRSADAVAKAWMDAEAYRLNTLWTATRGQCQQDPLVRDGPRHPPGRARPARPRSRVPRGRRRCTVARRIPLRPGGAHLRRHQRDPTQRGGRAHARTAARLTRSDDHALRLHRSTARVPGRRPPGPGQGVHDRRRACRL